jgi:hypothetical protein
VQLVTHVRLKASLFPYCSISGQLRSCIGAIGTVLLQAWQLGVIVGSLYCRRCAAASGVDMPLTLTRAVNDVRTILLYSILGQSQRRHPQMEERPRAQTRGDYMTNNVLSLAL